MSTFSMFIWFAIKIKYFHNRKVKRTKKKNMILYQTPTTQIFHNRKQFHAIQKAHDESISDWFNRLQMSVSKCEFCDLSDYMFIDKFVSGLNEGDFVKISQVANWTLNELVLVVLGNAHIFNTSQSKENNHNEDANNILKQIKSENTEKWQIDDDESEPNWESNEDFFEEDPIEVIKDDVESVDSNGDSTIHPTNKKISREVKKERNKKHIEKLKQTGRYNEYKKKKAECAKQRRLQVKNNEQYLPPEIQQHLANERRRATRERVKRWRDRKTIKIKQTIESSHTVWIEPEIEENVENEENEITEKIEQTKTSTANKNAAQPSAKRKSVYVRKRTFECYQCSLKCSKLYELKTHLTIFHPIEKKEVLMCPHCPKTTISLEVLSRHLKHDHGTVQMHKCPCCDEEFTRRGQLTEHLTTHPDYRPFICETCGSAFRTMSELNSHFRKHTGQKSYKCDICGLLLVSSSSFKGHIMRHTGEKPYECKMCGKRFRQVSSLRKHLISIHNQGQKRYLCTTCHKRFASIYHLRIHTNVHTGDRPYHCHYCASSFSQPPALKVHIARIHEKDLHLQKKQQQNLNQNIDPNLKS